VPPGGTAGDGVEHHGAEAVDLAVCIALVIGDDVEDAEVVEDAMAGLEGVAAESVVQLARPEGSG
jgi:hypothetical protein